MREELPHTACSCHLWGEDSQGSQGRPHTFITIGCTPRGQLSQPATHSKQINPGEAGSPQNNPENSWGFPDLRIPAIIPGKDSARLAPCLCTVCAQGVMAKAQPCMCPARGCALGHGTSST